MSHVERQAFGLTLFGSASLIASAAPTPFPGGRKFTTTLSGQNEVNATFLTGGNAILTVPESPLSPSTSVNSGSVGTLP